MRPARRAHCAARGLDPRQPDLFPRRHVPTFQVPDSANGTAHKSPISVSLFGGNDSLHQPPVPGALEPPRSDFLSQFDADPRRQVSFKFDLQNALRHMQQRQAESDGALGHLQGFSNAPDAGRIGSPINFWVSGRYIDFDSNSWRADRDGFVAWVTTGASYTFSPAFTLGVIGRYREGEVESKAVPASLDASMYGIGGYTIVNAWHGTRIRAGILYETGDNTITIQRDRNNKFDSDVLTVEVLMDKRFAVKHGWIEPTLGFIYNHADRDGYRQSCISCLGTIPDGKLTLGRLNYGSRFGTTWVAESGRQISPYLSVKGIWDFDNERDFEIAAIPTIDPPSGVFKTSSAGFDIGCGVDVAYVGGAVFSVRGNYFSFDSDLEGWYLTGGLSIPLR